MSVGIDPVQPEMVYVGTDFGGVFRSIDGGVSWDAANGGLGLLNGVQLMAIDPVNPATIYTGDSCQGISKTVDAGNTWSLVNAGLTDRCVSAFAVDPIEPETLYVGGSSGGVFKSTNGGGSWSPVNAGLTDLSIRALAIDPSTPSTLFTSTDGDGVFKSIDGGATWTASSIGLPSLFGASLVIDPSLPTTLYWQRGTIFKSDDGGATWRPANTGLDTLGVNSLAISPSASSTLFAGGQRGGVFRSDDGGSSWARVDTGLGSTRIDQLAVHPNNAAVIVGATVSGVVRSVDGGLTWTVSNDGLAATLPISLAVDPAVSGTVYAGTAASGLFKSVDGGRTWSTSAVGLTALRIPALAADPLNAGTLYAGAGGVFKSLDHGETWTPTGFEGGSVTALAIDPMNPMVVYAGTVSGAAFRSGDGGANWNRISSGLPSFRRIASMVVDPTQPSTVLAGFFPGGVFRSSDGGATWAPSSAGLPDFILALAFAPNGDLFAGSAGDGVFRSIDSGGTWVAVSAGRVHPFITALTTDPAAPDTVVAGTSGNGVNNGIARSFDGGSTWRTFNAGLPSFREPGAHALAIEAGAPATIYAGTAGGVFSLTQGADLSIGITESRDPVPAGGDLVYRVTIESLGPSNASDIEVLVAPSLPAGVSVLTITPDDGSFFDAGVWSLPGLVAGEQASLTLELSIGAATTPAVDVIGVAATVIAVTEPLINPDDDESTERTSVDSADTDGDGIVDASDNCPFDVNPGQEDRDGDGAGNACDSDDDNDGVEDFLDPDVLDPDVCGDADADSCDDCAVGSDDFGPLSDADPANDGPDTDGDGLCNAGDPPLNPSSVSSSSHTPSSWGGGQITALWSGASDGGGSGLAGYSVAFDNDPAGIPDSIVDVAHAGDSHSFTSTTLTGGQNHWFHLRTCDSNGVCSATVHLGPFWVDVTPPENPTGLTSTSHTVGTPSLDSTIDMSWAVAVDRTSGLDGYAYVFSDQAAPTCDEMLDLEETEASVTSDELADGEWFFHLCAVDSAGNWSSPIAAGPFTIEARPPQVTAVDSVASAGPGGLSRVTLPVTQILVTFDQDMDALEAADATNYQLTDGGADGEVTTTSCGLLDGDDDAIPFALADYDDSSRTTRLQIVNDSALPAGAYRILACATLTDVTGKPLDGNGDLSGGDDFVHPFEVLATDQLRNPNFDEDDSHWQLRSASPAEIGLSTADVHDASSSFSLAFLNLTGPESSFTAGQCLPIAPLQSSDVRGFLRVESSTTGAPFFSVRLGFFASRDCTGRSIDSLEQPVHLGDTGGAWMPFARERLSSQKASVGSVLIEFRLAAGGDDQLRANLDALFFGPTSVLFGDGFESGDTNAWSDEVP